MTIIDGRNSNAIPATLTKKQFDELSPEILEKYSPEWKSRETICLYLIDGYFVPSMYRENTLILCASYKNKKNALKWILRNYTHAIKID